MPPAPGDLLSIDFAVSVAGYHADAAITVGIGTLDRLLPERGLLLVGKGGLQRVVRVPEALYARLEALATRKAEEEPLFALLDRDVQRELRDACQRLGLPPTGPHGLRYDFAARLRVRLLAEGWAAEAADREVSLQLGHRRPAVTHHYLRGA